MKMRVIVCGLLAVAVISAALPGSAQKKGKSRPLTTSQLMAGLVKPQFVSLKEALEAGPKDDEAWKALATSAALLNESAYVMMADDRCPDASWKEGACILQEASRDVLQQIEARNAEAALKAVGGVLQSCKTCHAKHKYGKPLVENETSYCKDGGTSFGK